MIDPVRHLAVFSPEVFGEKRVDVIGCGATGSRIVLSLAKLGVKNIHVHDFDIIEGHNIANQIYGIEDIGKLKVDALDEIIKRDVGMSITTHAEEVDGSQQLGSIIYLLPDTMRARKVIWEGLKYKPGTELLIETRMGVDVGRVYTINPNSPIHIKAWEDTLHGDDEVEVSACGSSITVGSTAEIISGYAVWQMIRQFGVRTDDEPLFDNNEMIFSTRPMSMICRNF